MTNPRRARLPALATRCVKASPASSSKTSTGAPLSTATTGKGALFRLDPPYLACETWCSRDSFLRAGLAEMAKRLAGIKGRFIPSLNDRPEARERFSAFQFADVKLDYMIGGGGQKPVGEVFMPGGKDIRPDGYLPLFWGGIPLRPSRAGRGWCAVPDKRSGTLSCAEDCVPS